MRIGWVMVLTGSVAVLDTLRSVGRRGAAGPVGEGGPSVRCALLGKPPVPALAGMPANPNPREPALAGNALSDRGSGRHRMSERLTSTGSTVTPWRFRSSTMTLG